MIDLRCDFCHKKFGMCVSRDDKLVICPYCKKQVDISTDLKIISDCLITFSIHPKDYLPGDLLLQLKRAGLTMRQLSRIINVNYETIFSWGKGEFIPVEYHQALIDALGIQHDSTEDK